jgi:hypothetical protein
MTPEEFTGAVVLTVNDKKVEVAARPDMRLSRLLREELGLTGTKVGCDAGDCGACTVLIDEEQACACLVAAAQLEGRRVQTIEGIVSSSRRRPMRHLHPRHVDGFARSLAPCREAEPPHDRGRARRRAVPLHGLSQDLRGRARRSTLPRAR